MHSPCVCVCVCVQANAVIAHVTDAAGAIRKTSAKPVSMHARTHLTLESKGLPTRV